MSMRTDFSETDCEQQFTRLANLLATTPLPTTTGTRIAYPDEFMLMYTSGNDTMVAFKHRDTRYYVYVERGVGDGRDSLVLPTNPSHLFNAGPMDDEAFFVMAREMATEAGNNVYAACVRAYDNLTVKESGDNPRYLVRAIGSVVGPTATLRAFEAEATKPLAIRVKRILNKRSQ